MININWAIRIRDLDTTVTSSQYGLYLESTEYLFKWSLKPDTNSLDYTDGLLLDGFSSGFSKRVDIRRQGKYSSVGGGSLSVDNTTCFYQWLKSNEISLNGRRMEIVEIDTDTGDEEVIYTSIIGQSLKHDAKTLTIPYEDITRNRNVKITAPIEGKDNKYYPAVFGQVDKTKFVNETDTSEEFLWGTSEDTSIIWQVSDDAPASDKIGYQFQLKCEIATGIGSATYDLFEDAVDTGKIYARVVTGEGEGSTRLVDTVSQSSGTLLNVWLDESCYIDEGQPEWTTGQSYIKFYTVNYIDSTDQWDNSQGFQDYKLYTYPNQQYIEIPKLGAQFSVTDNKVELIADDLNDWGKVTGYKLYVPASVESGQDAIADPTDLDGITGTWYYYSTSKTWSNISGNTDTGAHNDSAISDLDYSTSATIDMYSSGFTNNFKGLAVYKLGFDSLEGEELYMNVNLDYTTDELTTGSKSTIVSYNNFGSEELSTILLEGDSTLAALCYFTNYDDSVLSNYSPPTYITGANREWWHNNLGGTYAPDSTNYFTGFDLYQIDTVANPLTTESTDIYFTLQINDAHTVSEQAEYSASIRQISVLSKLSDIDFTKGIYAEWWGRNYDTTDFGSGANDLIEPSYDVYNHICRLQNFASNGLSAPSSGWGLDYMTTGYTDVVDNTNVYGGLRYTTSGLYPLVARQVTVTTELDTKKLKDSVLKDMWAFGSIDGEGKEKLFPMEKAFDDTMTREEILYSDYTGNPKLTDRPLTDIFCQPYVLYDWDEASQSFLKGIRITNTEQSTYTPATDDYVTGDINDTTKTQLWDKGRLLYEVYGVINEAPDSIAKCYWIKDTTEAVLFLNRWLDWMGGTSDGFKDRREFPFTIPYEAGREKSIDIGSLVEIEIPYECDQENALGVITKVNVKLKEDKPEYSCTAYVEVPEVIITGDDIDESGSRADDIDENGTRTTDIDEGGY